MFFGLITSLGFSRCFELANVIYSRFILILDLLGVERDQISQGAFFVFNAKLEKKFAPQEI